MRSRTIAPPMRTAAPSGDAPRWWGALTGPVRAWPLGQRIGLLWLLVGLAAAALLPVGFPQPPAYHEFADSREWFGIPNFLNVVSNLAFVLAGAAALWDLRADEGPLRGRPGSWIWRVFFAGIVLTGAGSAWYHWAPDNAGLFWDRLPMTIAFAAFTGGVFAERFGARVGARVFWAALAAMAGGLVYWRATFGGMDNVAPYLIAMYGGAAITLFATVAFPSREPREAHAFVALIIFSAAMLFDAWLDRPLYLLGNVLSGHSLKHLLGALAAVWLWWFMLRGPAGRNSGG